jgi:hypothetical protein
MGIVALVLLIIGGGFASPPANADEGGVSFWLPGQNGSLVAVPSDPGWSFALVYYHADLEADGSQDIPAGGRVRVGLDVREDLWLAIPTYTFKTPVFGGQAAVSVAGVYGSAGANVDATLTGPGGGVLSGSAHDSRTDWGDLFPTGTLRWNHGNHNTMAYLGAGVPVGAYDADRLVSIGSNHWSLDGGGGYTYLNLETGREFSAAAGLTYNFENPDTHYQNGIDFHLDWGASQFLSERWHVGLVGYFYHQITGDSGTGAVLGDFKSGVDAIGPQVGHFFNIGKRQAYLNLKAYYEFNADHRLEGWNGWVTLSIPLGPVSK